MITAQILETIRNGENSKVGFKDEDVHPIQLAIDCVAFANLRGGRVFLGVDNDGTVTGIRRNDLESWVMNTVFGQYIYPKITPKYEEIQIDEMQRVAVVKVSQGICKPYVVRDRKREDIYIRFGSRSRLTTRSRLECSVTLSDLLKPDLLPVSGSGLADFNQECLRDYLASIYNYETTPVSDSDWQTHLSLLGFMTDGECEAQVATVAGILLFGNSPRRLLPQAGIQWMAFDGNDKNSRVLDNRMIDGSLVPLRSTEYRDGKSSTYQGIVDDLINAMIPFISAESEESKISLRRFKTWFYPVPVIREAVINAVAHRDWTRNEAIKVVRYEDRIEIVSPGALPSLMTVGKMIVGQRLPRNQLIVCVLRDYGYIDARGMGVRTKIIPQMKAHNGTEPEFIATEDYLKVILRRR